MPKCLGELAVKRADIAATIAALERNSRIVSRLGGAARVDVNDEAVFQRLRLALLDWAITADEAKIRAQKAAHESSLPLEALDAKYVGVTRGLPVGVISTLGYIELLELCLGEHPGQAHRPLVDAVETPATITALITSVAVADSTKLVEASRDLKAPLDQIAAPITVK